MKICGRPKQIGTTSRHRIKRARLTALRAAKYVDIVSLIGQIGLAVEQQDAAMFRLT